MKLLSHTNKFYLTFLIFLAPAIIALDYIYYPLPREQGSKRNTSL